MALVIWTTCRKLKILSANVLEDAGKPLKTSTVAGKGANALGYS